MWLLRSSMIVADKVYYALFLMVQYAITFSLHEYASACIVCQIMHHKIFYNLRNFGDEAW